MLSIRVPQSGIEFANLKMSMNPFCEIALEVRQSIPRFAKTDGMSPPLPSPTVLSHSLQGSVAGLRL